MQNHVMHTSRGSLSISVVCFLQIFVLSSNTKKGEIERAHSILLRFCVLVNNTRIHFTWISKCCRNYSLHRNIGKTKVRPESPPLRAGVSALPTRCLFERSCRHCQKPVRSWSGGGPESPHHPGVSGPLAGVSALMLPVYKRSSCRHNQMRVRSGSGGTPEFPHGPESPPPPGRSLRTKFFWIVGWSWSAAPEVHPEFSRSFRTCAESPDLQCGVSALSELQRSYFGMGYKYPFPYLRKVGSPRTDFSIVASSAPTQISFSLHPNLLIFGGLKEKHQIYIPTNPSLL